ncbi:MAG: hypothetical protein JKX98_02415 [Alcanivoracaceae bacterium]|nr:hypothetical protein [Alcanivoracaceae bacterium]
MKILQSTFLTSLLTATLISLATTTIADTTLTFTDKKDKIVMKMQFANNMMRATSVDDNSTYMIYDANNTTFTTFMTDKKEYFVMGQKEIEALSDIGAMMDKMLEKQMAEIPESQRAMMRGMMENMMKSQMPKQAPKAEYKLTGQSSSYNGFDCEIVIKKVKKNKAEFCVTEYSNLGMKDSEFAVITSFQHTIEALAQQYGADNSMDFSSLGNYMPVKYKQAGESGTLSDVNHDKLDINMFAIPQDYIKMEMPF